MKKRTNTDSGVKAAKDKRKKKSKIFASSNKGKTIHGLGKLLGGGMMIIGALIFGILLIQSMISGVEFSYMNFFFAIIFAVGFAIFRCAHSASKRMSRFRFYRSFLEERECILLNELAALTGRKVSFLQKDLWEMIDRKLFLQGNMDDEETCLFLTKDAYRRYKRGELWLGFLCD